MDDKAKTKQLFKILMAAAWIDGTIQVEERGYLHGMAQEQGIAEDPEIKGLLSEAKPVKIEECYQLLESYLGNNPAQEDYQKLIDAISALVYSDSNIDIEEAKLLNRIQLLDPAQESSHPPFDKILKAVQKLYRKAIN